MKRDSSIWLLGSISWLICNLTITSFILPALSENKFEYFSRISIVFTSLILDTIPKFSSASSPKIQPELPLLILNSEIKLLPLYSFISVLNSPIILIVSDDWLPKMVDFGLLSI